MITFLIFQFRSCAKYDFFNYVKNYLRMMKKHKEFRGYNFMSFDPCSYLSIQLET